MQNLDASFNQNELYSGIAGKIFSGARGIYVTMWDIESIQQPNLILLFLMMNLKISQVVFNKQVLNLSMVNILQYILTHFLGSIYISWQINFVTNLNPSRS